MGEVWIFMVFRGSGVIMFSNLGPRYEATCCPHRNLCSIPAGWLADWLAGWLAAGLAGTDGWET